MTATVEYSFLWIPLFLIIFTNKFQNFKDNHNFIKYQRKQQKNNPFSAIEMYDSKLNTTMGENIRNTCM